jgi:hypothetical protein
VTVEIRWQPADDVEVTLAVAETYTAAHLRRRAEAARLCALHEMPITLSMWERIVETDGTVVWVKVNDMTATITFEMSEPDEHDDTYYPPDEYYLPSPT